MQLYFRNAEGQWQSFFDQPQGAVIEANGNIDTNGFLASTFPICACSLLEETKMFSFRAILPLQSSIRAGSKLGQKMSI